MFSILGAIIGYSIYRFPGAVAGFVLGSFIDRLNFKKGPNQGTAGGQRQSRGPFSDIFQQATRGSRVTPADFELNLISLSSFVIKADGTVSQSELDYVRQYFVQAYGKERANATFKTFNEVIKSREMDPQRICMMLRARTRYESRLQMLHFLFSVANADGTVSTAEVNMIQRIAGYLSIQMADFESIKAMFFKNPDSAYKILEVDRNATDAEVKKAYREMVKKYHPDKLVHMDEAYQKGAEEKFRKVQEAYEQLQKERGF
ncbi:molecular chaperone DnaJ [Patiriisocius marinistellae]|uniref:Molecular chaperone DnaJ n=1 Tax=Patiriisocius marinistellae TaxID=2494560 RepID=A0A5J4FYM1_9FLAO|nr:TerB family tellurite resistance protein [Patiriisocius marinistellae]GEQ84761.1 molecular chaperone DnaJ [Patiriisocius marinistellae]